MDSEQITQTIAEIRNSVKKWGSLSIGGAVEQVETLLEITDYLQKTIEEKDDAIRRHVNSANFLSNEISEWSATAEAQAAEIERLKGQLKFHMQKHAGDGL